MDIVSKVQKLIEKDVNDAGYVIDEITYAK